MTKHTKSLLNWFFMVIFLLIFASFFELTLAHAENAPKLVTTREGLRAAVANAAEGSTILVGDIDFDFTSAGANFGKRINVKKSVTIKSGKANGEQAKFFGGSFFVEGPIDASEEISCIFDGIDFDGELDSYWEFWEDYWYNYAFSFKGKADVSIKNCSFSGYISDDGGALWCDYGENSGNEAYNLNISLENCEFSENASYGAGGAVYLKGYNKNVSFFADGCTFKNNTNGGCGYNSLGGGAIYAIDVKISLNDCNITGNIANLNSHLLSYDATGGGGIWCSNVQLNMKNCLVSENFASVGAGLNLLRTNAKIDGCTIENNRASTDATEPDPLRFVGNMGLGGGVYISSDSTSNTIFQNTSIRRNTAQRGGDGLYYFYGYEWAPNDNRGTVEFIFCTYTDNICETEYEIKGLEGFNYPGNIWEIPYISAYGCLFDGDERTVVADLTVKEKFPNSIGTFYSGSNYNPKVTIRLKGLQDLTFVYGENLKLPTPVKRGYRFDGWYTSEKKLFNTDGVIFGTDIEVYELTAKWTANISRWTVTFIFAGVVLILAAAEATITIKKRRNKVLETANESPVSFDGFANLTPREKEIIDLTLCHKTPKDIANELFISVETVRKHIKNIYEKLDVHSKEELIEKVKSKNNQ